VAEKRQTGSIKFYQGWFLLLNSKSVRYFYRLDLRHLETLGPLVVTSLHSVTTAQGLRISKFHKSLGLGI